MISQLFRARLVAQGVPAIDLAAHFVEGERRGLEHQFADFGDQQSLVGVLVIDMPLKAKSEFRGYHE